ncbi:hypothetical protein Pmani_031218 [Petrolisthes manimaculis]|uniref:Uncharacterized protein n=1 Tax=Petrolisthes manimaculis TaxID=1843537 RepID=A0AAE1NVM2_9EUCA|nr:hypothetical protein Pmani_031218 [Petrolisthes manimaculis]
METSAEGSHHHALTITLPRYNDGPGRQLRTHIVPTTLKGGPGGEVDGWVGRWMDGWGGGLVGGAVDGWVDWWVGGWVGRWIISGSVVLKGGSGVELWVLDMNQFNIGL